MFFVVFSNLKLVHLLSEICKENLNNQCIVNADYSLHETAADECRHKCLEAIKRVN